MSLVAGHVVKVSVGFPRVSGDEPGSYLTEKVWDKFSPRERG